MKSAAPAALIQSARPLFDATHPVPVSGFFPTRGELDTIPLLAHLHGRGFPVALPAIRDSLILAFRAYTPGEPLVPVRFQLHEPPETASAVIPQILLVPLLAFDRTGARLGYGGGYYDATLRHLRASGRDVVAVGAAFDEQEMPALPFEPHDERLDYILTPSRLIRLGV